MLTRIYNNSLRRALAPKQSRAKSSSTRPNFGGPRGPIIDHMPPKTFGVSVPVKKPAPLKKQSDEPKKLHISLSELIENSRWPDAVALWQQAKKDNTVTGKAHHVIFKEAVRRGQLDESREAFVDVKSESIDIDKSTYSKLIQVYARAHAVRDAEAVMAEMEEDGLDVPQDAIEAMMIAYMEMPNQEDNVKSFLLYQDMKSRGLIITPWTEQKLQAIFTAAGVTNEPVEGEEEYVEIMNTINKIR